MLLLFKSFLYFWNYTGQTSLKSSNAGKEKQEVIAVFHSLVLHFCNPPPYSESWLCCIQKLKGLRLSSGFHINCGPSLGVFALLKEWQAWQQCSGEVFFSGRHWEYTGSTRGFGSVKVADNPHIVNRLINNRQTDTHRDGLTLRLHSPCFIQPICQVSRANLTGSFLTSIAVFSTTDLLLFPENRYDREKELDLSCRNEYCPYDLSQSLTVFVGF